MRVELVRDSDGRQGWFLVEAWANYVGSRPRWTWSTQRRTPPASSFRRSWCASRSRRSSTAHGIGEGRLEVERIGEGHSNITFLVRRGDARVVLRRPPRPPLPPSAHDVLREARLLRALESTPVRVPTVIAVGDDETVLGVPFYVMEEMHGSVLASAIPPALDTPDERARTAEELVDALVEVHDVDWRACGLEGYGKPTGYLERQVRRFSGLWEHNKTRELPVVEELGEWLGRNMPESPESTIVHGDYRLGNVMMADARARRAGGDLRLGAVDDRRSAGGPGLPDRHLGRAGRPAGHDVRQPERGHPRAAASSPARS